jgi:hypothetical protein
MALTASAPVRSVSYFVAADACGDVYLWRVDDGMTHRCQPVLPKRGTQPYVWDEWVSLLAGPLPEELEF